MSSLPRRHGPCLFVMPMTSLFTILFIPCRDSMKYDVVVDCNESSSSYNTRIVVVTLPMQMMIMMMRIRTTISFSFIDPNISTKRTTLPYNNNNSNSNHHHHRNITPYLPTYHDIILPMILFIIYYAIQLRLIYGNKYEIWRLGGGGEKGTKEE